MFLIFPQVMLPNMEYVRLLFCFFLKMSLFLQMEDNLFCGWKIVSINVSLIGILFIWEYSV